MIRKRLAALILTAGLGMLCGCTSYLSFRPNGNGLFGHRNGTPVAADCCPTVGFSAGPDCCGPSCDVGGFPAMGGPMLAPQEPFGVMPVPGMQAMPPAGVPAPPPPPGMPMLTEPPLGSNTKLSPVPYSMPVPYFPTGH